MLITSGKTLAENVSNSYAQITADFTTPDAAMLTRLTRDVWSFSAAKNYQELRDLTLALRDENGKLREKEDYLKEAERICEKFDENWFSTEYDTAISSAQNAARYAEFDQEADVITNLRYQTVGDGNVRAEHALLDGIIRPANDPFWNKYYPPNGWNCRCEAVQSLDGFGRVTRESELPKVHIPELFNTNLAKTGCIFPKNHPYYKGIPKAELRKALAYLPPENTYLSVTINKGVNIDIHPWHGDLELDKNINACRDLNSLDKSAKIKLLPIIEEKDKAAKKLFLPDEYLKKFPLKNPDIIYNNRVGEIEISNGGKTSIQNAIKHGKKQSDFVLVKVPDGLELNSVSHIVNGQMKHYEDKENLTVWMFNNTGKIEFITKQKR
ncbi:minor capsid protein [Paludibacteraceae bacterium OttesenSCG-928-F17]|nr:minor capsid protein [Paludibacteraceae bacterium OttesenSCG-928-F17]